LLPKQYNKHSTMSGGFSDYAMVGQDTPLFPGEPYVPYGTLGHAQQTLHGLTTQKSRLEVPTPVDRNPSLAKENTFDLETLAMRVLELEKEEKERELEEEEEEKEEEEEEESNIARQYGDEDVDESVLMESIDGRYDEKIQELVAERQTLESERLQARQELRNVDKKLRSVNHDLTRFKAKEKLEWASKRTKGGIRYFRKRFGISSPSDISMSIQGSGEIPKGEMVTDSAIGSKFPYHVLGCNTEEEASDFRKISENFFKHQFNLDFSDKNPNVKVDDDGTRSIGDVVKMTPYAINTKLNHQVESLNKPMKKYAKIGHHVYEGGYMVLVMKPTELGGFYEAGHHKEGSNVPGGTKMMHGHIVVTDDNGEPSYIFLGGTHEPITPGHGSTKHTSYEHRGHLLGGYHHPYEVKMARDISTHGTGSEGRKVVMKTAIRGM